MWCSLHAASSDNEQTPKRPGAQCCLPKRGKGMDDTGARAREGCKGGKEENRMDAIHTQQHTNKQQTNNNKQNQNKGGARTTLHGRLNRKGKEVLFRGLEAPGARRGRGRRRRRGRRIVAAPTTDGQCTARHGCSICFPQSSVSLNRRAGLCAG